LLLKFFLAAAGFEPLPFQQAWIELPTAPIRTLEAPTGLGKTLATLVGWLWDHQHRPTETPRRLVYQLPLRILTEQIAVECRAVMARLVGGVHLRLFLPLVAGMDGWLVAGFGSAEMRQRAQAEWGAKGLGC
jgi:CRISPR/Cas system-associated endonuclease/helicase Cas3